MRTWIQALCLVVFTTFFVSCYEIVDEIAGMLEEQFPQPPHKTIKIKDSSGSENWPVHISEIAGQDVLLALTDKQPNPSNLDVESIMTSQVYALGEVRKDGTINLKLFHNVGDYWTGSGNYWIFFVLPDKSLSTITWLYMSKGSHNIYAENTQLYNTDFVGPIVLDIDISGVVPF
jgi:hypothetical protein